MRAVILEALNAEDDEDDDDDDDDDDAQHSRDSIQWKQAFSLLDGATPTMPFKK